MIRAFQWDLARQVERLDCLKKLLPRYAAWGYGELYLHLEDAVRYPGLPGIGRDDAYTYEELGELVLTAAKNGIRTVPIVNLLGHTQYLIKHPDWRDLNELRDAQDRPLERGQVCPLHPRTLEAAERLLRDLAPYCTAGKVHVGLDESFHLGKCPRCREEVARIGLAAHFAGHVRRLHALAGREGLQMGMWADMLCFVPEAIPLLPAGIVAYDWYYYPFTGKPRAELLNFAPYDLLPALRKQGIGYYGCPMNGAFRHEPLPVFGDRFANLRSWWRRCVGIGAEGFLVTSWESYRLALETTTVVDAGAASLWLEPDADDATTLLADGLRRMFRLKQPREIARKLLAADEHAFTGYARWQINDRWDVVAGNESLKPYAKEERFFARLQAAAGSWPRALAASIAFRHYLARRDVFVRQSARDIFQLRRLLAREKAPERRRTRRKEDPAALLARMQRHAAEFAAQVRAGRRAARVMWRRTRDPRARGQNEAALDADERRLDAWRRWLRQAAADPAVAWQATPVCGAWQLQFIVQNFAPAGQKVVVEQRSADGIWRELAARHTIEFRAAAARTRARIRREFNVPVDSPEAALRLSCRGIGQVAISDLAVTNGVEVRRPRNFRGNRVLGTPAPIAGWPDPDASGALQELAFVGSKSR